MFRKIRKCIVLISFGALLLYPLVSLADMSAGTYRIFADVISVGGGDFSGGTYSLNGNLGEPTIGIIASSTYEIKGGFQFMEISEDGNTSTISFSMSTSSLDLGTLSTEAVSQATTTATVTTDSSTGYTLAISSINNSLLSGVDDDSVTAGVEEYGIGLIGDNRVFSVDRSVEVRNISTTSTAVTADQTQVIFKAAISSETTGGNLSQTVTFTASVNP